MASPSPLSAAEQLKARHAAHNPTIEDVLDEDDIQHPPAVHVDPLSAETPTLSDVARGKQKAGAVPRPAAAFNLNSEEAFPSLGLGKPPPAAAQTWSRKPAIGANGNGNGNIPTNGSAPPAQYTRSPAGAPGLPANANRPSTGSVNLPGRVVESVALTPEQITKRSELKKPIPEVLRDLNKRSKAQLVMKTGVDGKTIFEATGPREAVRQALKDVVATIGSKVCVLHYFVRLTWLTRH